MGRQPVTVAGPRQICTAFPILPLPFGNGHLRRFGSAIKRAELESVKGALKIPPGFPRPNAPQGRLAAGSFSDENVQFFLTRRFYSSIKCIVNSALAANLVPPIGG